MKLFLAGANDKNWCEAVYLVNHPNFLTSYYEHRKGFKDSWIYWYQKTKKLGASWIMDSGLFTMMFGAGSDKKYSEKELLEYTHKYLNDMKKIGYKDYIVEMDVHKVLGLTALKKFRKIFEKNYPIEKTIFVWHIEEKEKGFKELCKKYPYIAISIPELRIVLKGRKSLKNAVKHLINVANNINPNIKIHLLGCTQQDLMEQKGYYSCDSTAWLSAGRFGDGYYWNMNKLAQLRTNSLGWSKYAEEMKPIVWKHQEAINMNQYYLNIILSGIAFSRFNEYINNKYYNYEPVKKLIK
jgi:hypothetical protein